MLGTEQRHEMMLEVPASGEVESGPDEIISVPLSILIELEQTRVTYSKEFLEELAGSMPKPDADGKLSFEIIHPPTVGVMDRAAFERYLKDHGQMFEVSHNIDEFVPHTDGNYYPVIAGHQRRRAMLLNGEIYGIPPEKIKMHISPKKNISFKDALSIQCRENHHATTPALEDARVVNRIAVLHLRDEGRPMRLKEIKAATGYGYEKIRLALRFHQLPGTIQQLTQNSYRDDGSLRHGPIISYSTACMLHPLMEAFDYLYRLRGETDKTYANPVSRANAVSNELEAFTNIFKTKSFKGESDTIKELVDGRIAAIKDMTTYKTEAFDFFLQEDPEERKSVTKRSMAKAAMNVIAATASTLGTEGVAQLEAIIAEAKKYARSSVESVPLYDLKTN